MTSVWGKGVNLILTMDEAQSLVLGTGILLQTSAMQQADSLCGCTACRARQLPTSERDGKNKWLWDTAQEFQIAMLKSVLSNMLDRAEPVGQNRQY